MSKKISITGIAARDKVMEGMNYLCDVVKSTIGPFGSNVLLEKGNHTTNDGFAISTELAGTVENEFARRGALAVHEVASKTVDVVGDATSSSMALVQAISKEIVRLLPNDHSLVAKRKPSEVSKLVTTSRDNVITKLHERVTQIETEAELIASARVSVEDEELAQLIGSTQWQIGKDGFIIAEEVIEPTCSVDIVKGIRIDNGFGTPFVVTNQAEQSLEVQDVNILLTNYTLHESDILALKERVIKPLLDNKKTQLVIMARAFSPETIKLCMDSFKAGFGLYPINAPYVYQSEIMKDLAAITGATYYDVEESRLEDLTIRDIGLASKLVARRFDAIVTGPKDGTGILIQEAVQKRVQELKERLVGNAISDFDRKAVQARIAQFEGGFAILKIGADTVFERKYKKDKADDAVHSVRLALQGGTVKGGGLAFKEIADELPEDDILKRALPCIYNQIIGSAPEGYEIPEWCRDPYLTLVAALTNACSVAVQLANINGVVTTKDIKPKEDETD